MASTARPRPTSTQPKPPTNFSPDCTIDASAQLAGIHPITVGSGAVIHPRARISSHHGRITIGPGCIIHSRAHIQISESAAASSPSSPTPELVLGRNVVVESRAHVAAAAVGEGSVVGVGAQVMGGAVLGRYCKVGPHCRVGEEEELANYTVVYGEGQRRLQRPGLEGLQAAAHEKQLEVLRKLIKSDLAKHAGPTPA